MINLLAIILSLWIAQLSTQQEFVDKSEAFIKLMLLDYKIDETNAKIDEYASSGASWSKRIDLKSKVHFLNKYDQKDYQEYSLTFVYFNDKNLCLKARQDYLDHFGLNGALTSETLGIKRSPSFNLISENTIVIFEVSCEGHKMDEKWSWDKVKNKLISIFASENDEIIENGCGGPITWKNNKNK